MRVISSPCWRRSPDLAFWASANAGENPGRNDWQPTLRARHNDPTWPPTRRDPHDVADPLHITDSDSHAAPRRSQTLGPPGDPKSPLRTTTASALNWTACRHRRSEAVLVDAAPGKRHLGHSTATGS